MRTEDPKGYLLLNRLRPALYLQFAHIILSILWNIAGMLLIARGMPALGPTASLSTILLLIAVGGMLILGAWRWPPLYIAVSLVAALGALSAIAPAFYKDPSLWASDCWRFAGVILNSVGLLGACWGIRICCKSRALGNQSA